MEQQIRMIQPRRQEKPSPQTHVRGSGSMEKALKGILENVAADSAFQAASESSSHGERERRSVPRLRPFMA